MIPRNILFLFLFLCIADVLSVVPKTMPPDRLVGTKNNIPAFPILPSPRKIHRRTFMQRSFQATIFTCTNAFQPAIVSAADDAAISAYAAGSTILTVKVTLPPEMSQESWPLAENSALYLTCRPDRADNVPAATLNGSRGKPPPVLSARIPLTSLSSNILPIEFDFVIPRDLTLEGAWDGKSTLPEDLSKFQPPSKAEELWWKQSDLIVSARWDSDGVAATRSPEDLVGRIKWKFGSGPAQVELTGRGAFGKFATGKKK